MVISSRLINCRPPSIPGCSHPTPGGTSRHRNVAKKNLHTALSAEHLAEAAHLSPRQFSRAFRAETGQSPAKAIENLRLEAARLMMEQTRHPIDVVARETGFADRRRMREAFLRGFGQPPQVIRRNAL
jgi:transcriptional regulator GlxA family with amidase domain